MTAAELEKESRPLRKKESH